MAYPERATELRDPYGRIRWHNYRDGASSLRQQQAFFFGGGNASAFAPRRHLAAAAGRADADLFADQISLPHRRKDPRLMRTGVGRCDDRRGRHQVSLGNGGSPSRSARPASVCSGRGAHRGLGRARSGVSVRLPLLVRVLGAKTGPAVGLELDTNVRKRWRTMRPLHPPLFQPDHAVSATLSYETYQACTSVRIRTNPERILVCICHRSTAFVRASTHSQSDGKASAAGRRD
jgi:hypothetical protein